MSTGIKIDEWVWGREQILWGFDPAHQYTLKVLEPKKGRLGCLSLQYHHEKSESWVVWRGKVWALLTVGNIVCTRIMGPGDGQNIPGGTIHRLMGLTDDAQVLEPSTPDRHAADKTVKKDVIRLHCVLGREVTPPRGPEEAALVSEAVKLTHEAIAAIESGNIPREINSDKLEGQSFKLGI